MATSLELALERAADTAAKMRSRVRSNYVREASASPMVGSSGAVTNLVDTTRIHQHAEQYRHYRGWVYVAANCIAHRLSSLPVYMGKISATPAKQAGMLGGSVSMQKAQPRGVRMLSDLERRRMPATLRAKHADLDIQVIENHPLLAALDDPNPIMVPWNVMFTTVVSLKLTGKSYWWLPRIGGRMQVWPIPAHWVTPKHTERRLFDHFEVRAPNQPGEPKIIPLEEMAYFAMPDPSSPLSTVSPLQSQSLAVSTDEKIQQAQFRAFENGIFPGLMITMGRLPGMFQGDIGARPLLTAEQRIEIISMIQELYGGTQNFNDPVIIDGMVEKVERLSNTIQEMDFLQSSASTKARVFQAFHVNPIVTGEVVNVGYAQAAVADSVFCEMAVNPISELIGQVMTKWVRLVEGDVSNQLVLWIEEARANDSQQTSRDWQIAITGKCVTKNEVRTHLLNLPPMEGKDGDELAGPQPPAPAVGGSGGGTSSGGGGNEKPKPKPNQEAENDQPENAPTAEEAQGGKSGLRVGDLGGQEAYDLEATAIRLGDLVSQKASLAKAVHQSQVVAQEVEVGKAAKGFFPRRRPQ